MRIAYPTLYDAQDVTNWSGLGLFIAKSLRDQSLDIELIGSVRNRYSPLSALTKGKGYLYKHVLKRNYLEHREPALLRSYARTVARQLCKLRADLVFSPGSIQIAYLDCNQPIVIWSDATFAGLVDFYPEYSNLCRESIRNGHAMEQAALDRCALAIYSSEWAAQTALDNYRIEQSRVRVVPFGANIESDRNTDKIRNLVEKRPSDRCKLLFIGVDWVRKGGDVAFQVAKGLNQSGLETELTVVGCSPTLGLPLPRFVKYLGFISKSTREGREKLDGLIAESHFLILPSVAECFGLVFCEANSLGVPCLATNVGGIPTAVRDDVNGKLFHTTADPAEYCRYVANLFDRYSDYKELAMSALREYQSRLNWSVAGNTVRQLLMNIG